MKELCEYKIITIKELMDIDVKKLPFQRLLQWDGKKYALYVDSLLDGITPGQFIIWDSDDNEGLVDGQHRYESIRRFINNENYIPRTNNDGEKYSVKFGSDEHDKIDDEYTYLTKEERENFYNIKVCTVNVNSDDIHEVIKVFERLNTGGQKLSKFDILYSIHYESEYWKTLNNLLCEIKIDDDDLQNDVLNFFELIGIIETSNGDSKKAILKKLRDNSKIKNRNIMELFFKFQCYMKIIKNIENFENLQQNDIENFKNVFNEILKKSDSLTSENAIEDFKNLYSYIKDLYDVSPLIGRYKFYIGTESNGKSNNELFFQILVGLRSKKKLPTRFKDHWSNWYNEMNINSLQFPTSSLDSNKSIFNAIKFVEKYFTYSVNGLKTITTVGK